MAGCATNDVARSKPGIPDGLGHGALLDSPVAQWIVRGESFAIVTWGSSSCPLVPASITADADDRITVTFESTDAEICTADMAPTTHEFALPPRTTVTPLMIDVVYEDWPEPDVLRLD